MSIRSLFASLGGIAVVAVAVSACSSSTEEDEGITYAKTIQPLVAEKCQSCHREGGIAPFSLSTYAEVRKMGEQAAYVVKERQMPPWGAFDDETCQVQHSFKDDLSLTDEQIATFAKWVELGMPQGDESKYPPAKKTYAASTLIDRTHLFEMKVDHELIAGNKDDIRCFPIDPGFTEDTWVGASNVLPGEPRVVHHVIVYVDPDGEGMKKAGDAKSYPCFGGPEIKNPSLLLAWAPGVPPGDYGEEAGLKVPKGAHLIMQVHYHPSPTTTYRDKSGFELKVLPYKPGFVAQVVLAGNAESADGDLLKLMPGPNDPNGKPQFVIPPNVPDHTETMELTIPTKIGDVDIPQMAINAVGAHMHWAGVDMKIEIERAAPPEGQPQKECLLGTPKYDFNWQRGYQYAGPVDKLPSIGPGDKVRFTCKYNNTTSNRHVVKAMSELRLSSPAEITLGEETLDEMCLGVFVATRRATLLD